MARSPASAESLVEKIRPFIGDERVLEAVAAVPRHLFVPAALSRFAWENTALPIGAGQTISQPVVVARMCEVLELGGEEKVLDVGTGSGYHAAVLAHLGREVWSIERKAKLAEQAQRNLAAAQLEHLAHARHDHGLRDGLSGADRQRGVLPREPGQGRGDERMPGHGRDGRQHPFVSYERPNLVDEALGRDG